MKSLKTSKRLEMVILTTSLWEKEIQYTVLDSLRNNLKVDSACLSLMSTQLHRLHKNRRTKDARIRCTLLLISSSKRRHLSWVLTSLNKEIIQRTMTKEDFPKYFLRLAKLLTQDLSVVFIIRNLVRSKKLSKMEMSMDYKLNFHTISPSFFCVESLLEDPQHQVKFLKRVDCSQRARNWMTKVKSRTFIHPEPTETGYWDNRFVLRLTKK